MTIPSLAFFLYGVVAMLGQLLCLAELLIVFSGHELFLGFSLAAWMGWVGGGSWLARRFNPRWLAFVALSFIPVFISTVGFIRLSKCLFGFGMLIGPLPTFVLTTAVLAPIGLATGLFFGLGCRWSQEQYGFGLGAAYLWDTLGSAAGGLAYCWLIAGRVPPEATIALLAIPAAALGIAVSQGFRNRILAALLTLILAFAFYLSELGHWTRQMQWRGYTLIAEHASRYSHLLLGRIGNLITLFSNGVIEAHFPDPQAFEELVHWPLLVHPAPRRVLIIGGAATGYLREILKHPVDQVDYVEIDPAVVRILKPVLPPADQAALDDLRVRIIPSDGRVWLGRGAAVYDVILLALPEPANAQVNRLYTREAFTAIRKRLAPSGIFAFTIPSSENYLSEQTTFFNACLYKTLKASFPHVQLVAGNPLLLIAGLADIAPVVNDAEILTARYGQRRLTTVEVVPSYFPLKLDSRRRELLTNRLLAVHLPLLNTDFLPVCYAYAWRLWLSRFASPFYFLGGVAILVLFFGALRALWRRRKAILGTPGAIALFALGAAGIVYETVLILAFQSLAGAIYWQLGTLFAAFMIGLAVGSGLATALASKLDMAKAACGLRWLIAVTGLEGLLLVWILSRIGLLSSWPIFIGWLLPFSLLLVITGIWLGAAFPLAGRLLSSGSTAIAPPTLYAADLWGAALGAILTSAFLVPLAGFHFTLAATGIVLLLISHLCKGG